MIKVVLIDVNCVVRSHDVLRNGTHPRHRLGILLILLHLTMNRQMLNSNMKELE